ADIPAAYKKRFLMPRKTSIVPETFEASRRQLGVPDGVLDVLVAQVGLQAPSIDALVREVIAASMPQHGRVHREIKLDRHAEARNQLTESCSREGRSALRRENKRRLRILLPPKPAQCTQFTARQRMNTRRARLSPIHVQPTVREIDRIPPERDQLG